MKKFAGFLIVTLSAVLSLTAIADSTVNVIFRHYGDDQWIIDVKNAYEAKYPDKKVKFNIFKGTENDYFTKLALLLRSDSDIDVVFEDGFMLQCDVNAGILAPIPVDKWNEWNNFYPSVRDSVTIDGKVYGIPISTDTRGLYYNINLFKQAGIEVPWQPKNWNDILNAARKIKEKLPDIMPISFNVGAYGEATTMQTLEMLLYGTNNGLKKDGKWVARSPGFLNSLKFIDTVYKEKLGAPLSVVLNTQYNSNVGNTLMPNQKVAIVLDGCWITLSWTGKIENTINWYKFIPMPTQLGQDPGYVSMSGGILLSINSKSKNQEGAFDFIKFALNKENSMLSTKLSRGLATREDVAADKDYPAFLKDATSFIKFTHFRPADEYYPKISPYIQKAVESVACGHATPEEAMDQYAQAVMKLVGKDNVVEIQ